VTDVRTGETVDLVDSVFAEELCDLLEQAEAGELDPLPPNASPFQRYAVMSGRNGWYHLLRQEGTVVGQPLGRTRSGAFGSRITDALNHANPSNASRSPRPREGELVLIAV
jgi:hypothetical protein